MVKNMPGTALKFYEESAENCYSIIAPLFAVTKGLTLSQVCDLTGLESSTIQNWVKRGWVKSPENKKYGEEQVIRIILINTMRAAMELQQITYLLEYINGKVDDRSDDILPDSELYNVLCRIVYKSENISPVDTNALDDLISGSINGVHLKDEKSKEKLKTALRAMALAIISGRVRELALNAYDKLLENNL